MTMTMKEYTFPSKSTPGVSYTVKAAADGAMSCDCRGWLMKRGGGPRECTHTKQVAAKGGAVGGPPAAARRETVTDADTHPIGYIQPMLAIRTPDELTTIDQWVAAHEPGEWIMEEKFDGHRVILAVDGGRVRAWSRPKSGTTVGKTRDLPAHIVKAAAKLPDGTYDGETYVPGGKSSHVQELAFRDEQVLVLFDILRMGTVDVTGQPWSKRRAALDAFSVWSKGKAIRLSPTFPPCAAGLAAIWKRGGEGVILKRTRSLYSPGGRTTDWIKVKRRGSIAVQVTGFAEEKCGPFSVVIFRAPDGDTGRVRMATNEARAALAKEGAANATHPAIGRWFVIEFHERTAAGSFREPHFERWGVL